MDRQSFVTPYGETLAASYSLPYLIPAVHLPGFFCSVALISNPHTIFAATRMRLIKCVRVCPAVEEDSE